MKDQPARSTSLSEFFITLRGKIVSTRSIFPRRKLSSAWGLAAGSDSHALTTYFLLYARPYVGDAKVITNN